MINIGAMLGERYEIIEKVGSGGMADVYRAMDHRLNRYVAVKILKTGYSEDTKFVAKFHQEAQAIACLSHPNIVGVYDVGEENGMHFFVMEFVDGITLKKYIEKNGKLSVREAVGIGLQIANGLEAAHANHIIHRDIKPQNILLSKDGTAKVTDFGIAKAASSNTITANAMGSVHYISPEQARGGFSDEKSDIYSLGVTIYEMLSGTLPFTGESAVAIALAHIQEDATPLAAIDATIPHGISNIVAKCMQKKTELRYPTAADLIADMKMFLQDPAGDYGIVRNLYENADTIFIPSGDVNARKNNVIQNGNQDMGKEEKSGEEEGEVDPKLEKALIIGSVTVAIIIGIIIIYMVGRLIGFWGGSSPKEEETPKPVATEESEATGEPEASDDGNTEQVQVPNVVGKTQEEAKSLLDEEELTYEFKTKSSDTAEEGKIIETSPAAGEFVDKGSMVTVYYAVKRTQLMSVIGKTPEDAEQELRNNGYVPVRGEDVFSDSVASGKVASTNPKAGENVSPGARVTYFVSKGTEMATVPYLLGKTQSQAKSALTKANLKLGKVRSSYSDSFSKNRVCVQSKSSGQSVKRGTTVDITLSLGKEPTYSYVSTKNITITNPFDYNTDPAATIKFVLVQDGKQIALSEFSGKKTYADFPMQISAGSIRGVSISEGQLDVYKDDRRVDTYNVSFREVAE